MAASDLWASLHDSDRAILLNDTLHILSASQSAFNGIADLYK
jgi:hypothetical protein